MVVSALEAKPEIEPQKIVVRIEEPLAGWLRKSSMTEIKRRVVAMNYLSQERRVVALEEFLAPDCLPILSEKIAHADMPYQTGFLFESPVKGEIPEAIKNAVLKFIAE